MIICLSCGNPNEPGTGFCTQCNARLPKIDAVSVQSGAGHVTGRFEQIREAGMKVKQGTWSSEEFGEYIQNVYQLLKEHAEATIAYIQETGYHEYGGEEVEHGLSGVEKFEEGLERMFCFVEDGDAQHIDAGLEMIWEGNELINEAMKFNRAARRRLEEEWGYM
ncbi:MAG: hypothetical protein AB1758_10075 [Candidatus Eremiobacterota bacterium]